jgi:undecaprenyl-diphosphatase
VSFFHAFALGLVQGFAEFLPISSSGHLMLVEYFFALSPPLLFNLFLHVATLLATVLYFRTIISRLFAALFRFLFRKPALADDSASLRTIAAIIVSTVATALVGFALRGVVHDASLRLVGIGFLVTGVTLVASSLLSQTSTVGIVTLPKALITGFAQGVAVLPGLSRSGTTISALLFCGVRRKDAGDFSFLLSLPAILGGFILELGDLSGMSATISAPALAVGFVTAFAAALLALRVFMGLVKRGRLAWFACYLVPLGVYVILFL